LQFEGHVNIKFMCKLGKSASEMLSALQQVYSDTELQKFTVYDGFPGLRMDRRHCRMTSTVGSLRHPEPKK
jgi:hypothetical protein